jgi:NAD(P)H-dependent flavin oxidoreductase YrpB (nitropropane dioxygenase family)
MSLPTALTEMVRIEHPIVLAPMGGVAGGVLAAAVSEGGGLGLITTELDSASALVARIAQDAEHTITATGNTVRAPRVRHCHER